MNGALAYVPVEELGDQPHVLVDGAPRPNSVLTLSHWPQSPTPEALQRDLSAEIVFAFLSAFQVEAAGAGGSAPAAAGVLTGLRERRRRYRPKSELESAIRGARRAEAVTNDHFDEDGLVSVFAMTDPDAALGHEELLVEVASCGDFGVVSSRRAARIAFAIGPLAEAAAAEEIGPFPPAGQGSRTGPRYRGVLEHFLELLEHPDRFRRYWQEEDALFEAALHELRAGHVQITEVPDVDLAIVTRAGGTTSAVGFNEVALHSATAASRILEMDGGRCELYLRYEGWVRYTSRRVPCRPDLGPLAEQLSRAEPNGISWKADGVGSIITMMRPEPGGCSDLDPDRISAAVVSYLATAPPAWDPFRRGGGLVPAGEPSVDRQAPKREPAL